MSQFEGDMPKCEGDVQEMQNPMLVSSEKKKSIVDKYFAPITT